MVWRSASWRCVLASPHFLVHSSAQFFSDFNLFNGTIQEEFVDYHVNLLFDDTARFNEKLKEYLLFYNTKPVHCAFKNKRTPLEVLTASEYYVKQLPAECKDGWGHSPFYGSELVQMWEPDKINVLEGTIWWLYTVSAKNTSAFSGYNV